MSIVYYISSFFTVLMAAILTIYIYKRFGAEPAKLSIIAFLSGVAWILAVIFSDFLAVLLYNTQKPPTRQPELCLLLIAGFVREFGKFLILKLYAMPKANFKGPIHGIFFALFVALGFSASSIVWSGINPFFEDTAGLRAIFTFPVNLTTAIILGFFVGYAKGRKSLQLYLLAGLGAATLFHALYEFLLLSGKYSVMPVYFAISMVLAGVLGIQALKIAKSQGHAR